MSEEQPTLAQDPGRAEGRARRHWTPGERDPLGAAMSRLAANARAIAARPAAIEAVDLTCRAGERALLDRASVRAARGELVALLGPSGSGKSTLLRALAGDRLPDAGDVRLGGAVADAARLQREVGYVPQDDVLHEELTPAQALGALARLRLPAALRRARVDEVLATLELEGCRDVQARRLSGGQRKRLSLGLELVLAPGVVVLDEPTASLDPPLQARLVALLRRLADGGRAVIVSTHQLEHLAAFDRVVVLHDGRVTFDGPASALGGSARLDPAELLERPPEPARRARLARAARAAPPHPRVGLATTLAQVPTLAAREVAQLRGEPRRVGLLLLQAPLLALILAIGLSDPAPLLLLLVLAAVWCGTSTGARAVVRERAVLVRERRHGVAPLAVLAAKAAVLGALTGAQAALLLAGVVLLRDLPGAAGPLLLALLAAGGTGLLVGFAISALARTADQANGLVPLALIPQVLFTVAPLPPEATARAAARLVPSRWAYDLAVRLADEHDDERDAGARLVLEPEHERRLARIDELDLELRATLARIAPPAAPGGAIDASSVEVARGRLLGAVDDLAAVASDVDARAQAAEDCARRLDERLEVNGRRARDLQTYKDTRRWPGLPPPPDDRRLRWEYHQTALERVYQTTEAMVADGPATARAAGDLSRALRALRDEAERGAAARARLERSIGALDPLFADLEAHKARLDALGATAVAARADAERLARALADERDALRADAPRLARLEAWGSTDRDLLALLGFSLAGLLVALVSLDRARA